MKKSIYLSLLAVSVVAYSCKKDNDKEKSTQEKLIGKWTMTSDKENEYYLNAPHYDSTTYESGLINLEFTSNGKKITYSNFTSRRDTTSYKWISDTKLKFDNVTDTFTITILTDKDLQLYHKEQHSATTYELWENFKKLQ